MTAKIYKLQQLSESIVCKMLGRSVDVHLHNDTVFVTRRIQEKVGEQQCSLHICFFKTKKAYDAACEQKHHLAIASKVRLTTSVTLIHKLHEGI